MSPLYSSAQGDLQNRLAQNSFKVYFCIKEHTSIMDFTWSNSYIKISIRCWKVNSSIHFYLSEIEPRKVQDQSKLKGLARTQGP